MPKPRNYLVNPYYVPKPVVPHPPVINGALVRFQPPSIPIYPRPFTPPSPPLIQRLLSGVPSAARSLKAASSIRGIAAAVGTASKVAGGFKFPVAAMGRGAGLVARRLPYVGWAFLALDGLLLACAAGLLPDPLCPRPDRPILKNTEPPFKGGQCLGATYLITVSGVDNSGQSFTNSPYVTYGRIFYTLNNYAEPNAGGEVLWNFIVYSYNFSGQPFGDVRTSLYYTPGVTSKPYASISKIERIDGGLDDCGDLPGETIAQTIPSEVINISNIVNNININITIPNPLAPSPLPIRAPIILIAPSPLPDINIEIDGDYPPTIATIENPDFTFTPAVSFNPNSSLNSNDWADIYNNFPPTAQLTLAYPNLSPVSPAEVGLAPIVVSNPELPPPLPNFLPSDATDSDKYQFRQNKETLDKVYKANSEILEIQKEQRRQGKLLENIQGLLDFEVEGSQLITRCDDIDTFYSYKGKILEAINQQLNQVKIIEQTIISEICQVEASAVVAAPDWWAVRLGGDIPQLALIFRVAKTRTYHTLVVPHPINTTPLKIAPIPNYKKGNWMGMITCRDNSKFICNCGTKGEATRLLFIAASLIDPIFLGDPVRFYYAERKGGAVAEGDMRGTSAQYFPTGQRQTKPMWRVTFTRDGQ